MPSVPLWLKACRLKNVELGGSRLFLKEKKLSPGRYACVVRILSLRLGLLHFDHFHLLALCGVLRHRTISSGVLRH